jgi:hypothetical protein
MEGNMFRASTRTGESYFPVNGSGTLVAEL